MNGRRWLVGLLGGSTLAYYTHRYPWTNVPQAMFTMPEAAKVVHVLGVAGTLAVVDLAAVAAGRPLWALVRPSGRADDLALPARLGTGLLVLANAVLLLAAVHRLERPALLGLLVLPILAQAVPLAGDARRWLRRQRRRTWSGTAGAEVTVVAVLGIVPFLCAFVPYYGWDALTYHLAIPERYLFFNGIWTSPFSIFTAFPLTVEMLYALALGVSGPALAKLVAAQFGLALVWVGFRLARRTSARASLLVLLLFAGDALVQFELCIAYTDLATAFYAVLAIAALADLPETADAATAWRCALFAGACVAVKLPGATVPAVAVVLTAVAPGLPWPARVRGVAAIGLASAALLLPWIARNWVLTGDPVAPMAQSLFLPDRPYFDPVAVEQVVAFARAAGTGRTLTSLLALPWHLTMTSVPGVYVDSFGYQAGPLYFVGVLAALLATAARRDRLVATLLVAGALLTLGWFLGSQEARLLLPALVMFTVAGAIGFDRLVGDGHAWSRLLLLLPVAAAVYGSGRALANVSWYYAYALGSLDPVSYERRDPVAQAGALLAERMRPGERVLLVFEGRGWLVRGVDYVPSVPYQGSPALQLIHRAPDLHALRCRLAELGITYLLVDEPALARYPPMPVGDYDDRDLAADRARVTELLRTATRQIATFDGVQVARLEPDDGCGATERQAVSDGREPDR
jgi:hypothetical protein